jgi:DNA ligase-1
MFVRFFCLLFLSFSALQADLLLAKPAPEGFDPTGWWMSEKYDGVRGFWDGQQLLTRNANVIHAPAYFTDQLPPMALDGELWMGHGQFEESASVVLSHTPDERWKQMRFMIFDAPAHSGGFEARLEVAREAIGNGHSPQIEVISQTRCRGVKHLNETLEAIEAHGGEGVMLRAPNSPYESGRSDMLLKVKSHQEAEAVVVAYKPGQGKYEGMVGSLKVRLENGRHLFIGSGLSDAQRADPPPIGAIITYRYRGYTRTGLPRFATFYRVRADYNASD